MNARRRSHQEMNLQQAAVRTGGRRRTREVGFESLMTSIAQRLDALPRQLRSIAQLALDSPETFAFGTAAELAQAAGVQPSALVRFAAAFDFDGFAAMRQVFRTHLVARAPTYRERIQSMRRTSAAATAGDIVRAQIDEAVAGLQPLAARARRPRADRRGRSARAGAARPPAGRAALLPGGQLSRVRAGAARAPRDAARRRRRHERPVGGRARRGRSAAGRQLPQLHAGGDRHRAPAPAVVAAEVIGITDSRASPLVPNASLALLLGDDRRSPFRSLVEPIVLAQALVIALGHRLSEAPPRRNGARPNGARR